MRLSRLQKDTVIFRSRLNNLPLPAMGSPDFLMALIYKIETGP